MTTVTNIFFIDVFTKYFKMSVASFSNGLFLSGKQSNTQICAINIYMRQR